MNPLQLAPDIPINLYFCKLVDHHLNDEETAIVRGWLNADEVVKVDRFKQADMRVKGLLVRGYLRGLLSWYSRELGLNIPPKDWQFCYGAKGKPSLTPHFYQLTRLMFNISHSGDYLLVAITQGEQNLELGVDIERPRRRIDIHSIGKNYFTAVEYQNLLSLEDDKQRQRFFDLWVLKEAFIKAKGLGLALSLKSFSFEFGNITRRPWSVLDGESEGCYHLHHNIDAYLHQNNQRILATDYRFVLGHLANHYRFAIGVNLPDALTLCGKQLSLSQIIGQVG